MPKTNLCQVKKSMVPTRVRAAIAAGIEEMHLGNKKGLANAIGMNYRTLVARLSKNDDDTMAMRLDEFCRIAKKMKWTKEQIGEMLYESK